MPGERIRIISLKDKFDSWDEMFPSSISQLIDAIGAFPGDIQASKIAAARIRAVKTKKKSSFQIVRRIERIDVSACIIMEQALKI